VTQSSRPSNRKLVQMDTYTFATSRQIDFPVHIKMYVSLLRRNDFLSYHSITTHDLLEIGVVENAIFD
jgi:hypothetical protein